ncbi:MAG: glycerol-3-phosphate 1-O-acyltransferase PlsY [Clostridia bacterium]
MFGCIVKYWWQFMLLALGCYLFASFNFAVLISRLFEKKDIRSEGSHNPGTTNMFRVFGFLPGFATFILDLLKGLLCALVARLIFNNIDSATVTFASYFAGTFAVIGHIFPLFFHFQGGKGVATTLGIVAFLQPYFFLCLIIPSVIIIALTDRMSIFALFFVTVTVIYHWIMSALGLVAIEESILFTIIFALVVFAHRNNIKRLIKREELPMGLKKAFCKVFKK